MLARYLHTFTDEIVKHTDVSLSTQLNSSVIYVQISLELLDYFEMMQYAILSMP